MVAHESETEPERAVLSGLGVHEEHEYAKTEVKQAVRVMFGKGETGGGGQWNLPVNVNMRVLAAVGDVRSCRRRLELMPGAQ